MFVNCCATTTVLMSAEEPDLLRGDDHAFTEIWPLVDSNDRGPKEKCRALAAARARLAI